MPRRNSGSSDPGDDESYDEEEDEVHVSDDEYRMDDDDEDDEDGRRHKRARGEAPHTTIAAPSRPPPPVQHGGAPAADPARGVDVSKLVVPANPFAASTLKWAAYQVLTHAGADGLRAEEILARVRALGMGDLTSSKTPEASIIGATAYDLQFCRTAPKRYALAFLHYGGRIPPYNERKPMVGRPPGRSGGRSAPAGGGRGRRPGGDDRFGGTPGDRPYGSGFGGFISSTRPRREAAQRAVAGMASHLAAEGDSLGGDRDGGPDGQQQAQQPSTAAVLAPLRRAVPAAPLQPWPRVEGRQVLTGMSGPLASVDAPVPQGVYVLRAPGFERQPPGPGGTSPAFDPASILPRFSLCWYDAWNGLLHARTGHTTGAATLNGTPLEPFTELTLRPGHSLALSGADYWRGETLPDDLLARLPSRSQAAGGGPQSQAPVDRTYRPAPGGWGNFYSSDAAAAAADAVAVTPGGSRPFGGGGSHRGYYLSPSAGLANSHLTQQQQDMADGVDEHVLQLLAAAIPPGFTARSWREDARPIDDLRRQFLYMLCDPTSGDSGAEVLAVVGVETTRYHPKFTITQPGLTFAHPRPPSLSTKRRQDVKRFLDSCLNRACVDGFAAGHFGGADLGIGAASGDSGSDSDRGSD